MTPLQQTIVNTATSLIGIKEIEPNQGWQNAPEFTADMIRLCHWKKGDEWCADTGKVIWYRSHPAENHDLLNRYFSANCMETWHNFRNSPEFHTSTSEPVPGALAIWQLSRGGKPTNMGHMGLVTKFLLPHFSAIEGNTSATGTRTGNIIWQNPHTVGKLYNPDNLNFVGFIYPDRIK